MGIWVRSQDKKTLIKVYTVGVYEKSVSGYSQDSSFRPLGEYDSEAEALKVLDMIEGSLESLTVFQMPPAGFSEEDNREAIEIMEGCYVCKECGAVHKVGYECNRDPYAGHDEIE